MENFAEKAIFDQLNFDRIEQGTTDLEAKFLIGKLKKENAEIREDNRKIKEEINDMIEAYTQLQNAILKIKEIFMDL